jgi:8-oxo-dGTP diphosphatase
VDAVVFTRRGGQREVLLIKRGNPPFQGMWALPGGFVEMDEDLPTAAARELEEEAGVRDIDLVQFHAFGRVDRDPRARTISIAYYGVTDWNDHRPKADSDAADVLWFPVADLPELAYDHAEIVAMALARVEDQE